MVINAVLSGLPAYLNCSYNIPNSDQEWKLVEERLESRPTIAASGLSTVVSVAEPVAKRKADSLAKPTSVAVAVRKGDTHKRKKHKSAKKAS